MKRTASTFAALLTIASLAIARGAFAADIGTCVTNAASSTITETSLDSGDTLFVYEYAANTTYELTLEKQCQAWILAVGGGGGGGGGATATAQNTKGSGGGGGAGGMLETNGVKLAAGTYTITVGNGGTAGASGKTGGSGGDSSVVLSSDMQFVAVGGGGGAGAGLGVGATGGSGGGSSYDGSSSAEGGASTNNLGCAGGSAAASAGGAGGGGAGGEGGSVTTSGSGGKGGAGKASSITGSSVTYAPGGGGGAKKTGGQGSGGLGDGSGDGAGNTSAASPTAGKDGIGGGGGGGSIASSRRGAAGGCGIVVIRITKIYGEIPVPVIKDYDYTGDAVTVWEGDDECTIEGDALTQTNVGNYSFTATPKEGSCWKGGSEEAKTFNWSIVKASNSLKIIQDGWVEGSPVDTICEYTICEASDEPTVTYSTESNGTYEATVPVSAGTYWVKASITETSNYYGVEAGPQPFRILGTTEPPNENFGFYLPVTFPSYSGSGTALISFYLSSGFNYGINDKTNACLCVCAADGTVYPQEVSWSASAPTINVEVDEMRSDKVLYLCWGLVEGGTAPTLTAPSLTEATSLTPSSAGDAVRDVDKTLKNYIEDLSMANWRLGETAPSGSYRYMIGTPVEVYTDSDGNQVSWSDVTSTAGTYTLTVSIPEETGTDNYGPYSGVPETSVTFRVLGEMETPLTDGTLKYFAEITAGTAVSSAGKVTVSVPSTHNWVASYNDGTDVRFCDIEGNLYPSSLITWGGDGSAEFSVEVPAMAAGDRFFMCWGETVGKTAPTVAAPSATTVAGSFSVGSTVIDTTLTLKNWVTGLTMSGYRLNVDTPTMPTAVAKIGTIKYQYSLFQTTSFEDYVSNPPPVGTFYLRAIVEASTSDGYESATSDVKKFRVLGETESPLDSLAYFSHITASGTLDEASGITFTLPATLDYTTIYNDGSDIRFCDADGNILPSYLSNWATNGTGTVLVELPAFSSSYVFYMCWGPVLGQTIPSTSTPTTTSGSVTTTPDAAVLDTTKWPLVNHWVVSPVFPKAWATNDTPEYTAGVPAYGTFQILCRNIATADESIITSLPTTAGDYELISFVDAGESGGLKWAAMTNEAWEVAIAAHNPSISLTRNRGAEGRVLLMNADVTPGSEIDNQGYADNDPSYSTFWVHADDIPATYADYFNISNSTSSALWTSNQASRLWTLVKCRHGNLFYNLDIDSTATYYDSLQNYLPCSENARDIGEHASTVHTRNGAGNIIMLNTTNACVYSSCLDDGIGTIYFDAVNSGKIASTVLSDYFHLKVWYATDCIDSLGNVIDVAPTDEYMHELDETEIEEGALITNVNWQVASVVPIKIENGLIASTATKTNTVILDVKQGSSDRYFYRVVVPLDIKGPARFKIARSSWSGKLTDDEDAFLNYILLDNIIASYPAMSADITTFGSYDNEATGKQVLGQRMALNEAFPSVESTDLRGRGKVTYYTNGGVENPETNKFITSARFYYRWRYLNQSFYHDEKFYTYDDGIFDSVRLSSGNADYASLRSLKVPALPGDIEYWYELSLAAPYYEYVDYSGLDIGVGGYSEEKSNVVCRADASYANLPSGGTNWFVRLREGASSFEKMVLTVTDSSVDPPKTEFINMDLIGSHQWRGFVVVTNKTERDLQFYLVGRNPQTDGDTEFVDTAENDVEFRAKVDAIDISSTPYAGIMAQVGEDVGYRAGIHYLTNVASYIEFQFNDSTKAISISHADWQDFNEWFSSRSDDASNLKFYSSAHETNSTTVAKKRYPAKATDGTTKSVLTTFAQTPRTATAWYENFAIDSAQSLAGFPMNEFFASKRTPKGWLADQGMWVAQNWGYTNSTDFALQMEGRGKGSVTFNLTPTPNGLDTIEFSTRLAQFNDFDSISYSYENYSIQNYTIAAQACFDTSTTFENFSGEASVSLITGYRPKKGCYEYRITIYNLDDASSDYACCRHSIYKWYVEGASLVSTQLVEVLGSQFGNWRWPTKNKTKAELVKCLPLGCDGLNYSGMYMSFSNENDKVIITAGVTAIENGDYGNGKETPKADFTYSGKRFLQIGCEDRDPVTTKGTFGVLMKNCPGEVLFPRVYQGKNVPLPTEGVTSVSGGSAWAGEVGLIADTASCEKQRSHFAEDWAFEPGRTEYDDSTASSALWGIYASADLEQTVSVYTMPVGSSSEWTLLTNITVNSFADTTHSEILQSRQPCYVKFAAGGESTDERTDVVIDDIKLTQWCGQSGSSTNAASSYGYYQDFYYTGSWISNRTAKVGNKTTTNPVALLAPRRAESATTPVGIRTPYLEGLGAIVFKYCDVGEDAKIQLQCWRGGANYLYGHLDDAADSSDWTTLTNWTLTAGSSGTMSYYFGQRAPSNGVFRIVIPQDKVVEAYEHGEYDPNWAAVTITDIYCHDEPAFDSHSWWGWNFLTTGWSDGKGNAYAALDDYEAGAVGVLNNTASDTTTLRTGDVEDYNKNDPFIQSPTFSGRNVGEISFRARQYAAGAASYVTVWGAKTGELQSPSSWIAITNFVIDSVSYVRYTAKCADEQGFSAIRLGVANVPGVDDKYKMTPADSPVYPSNVPRVLLDEIVIRERAKPEVGFKVLLPFRLGLSDRTPVLNIASRDQQPLLNEQFGFQAEIEVTGLSEEVDMSRTPVVTLSYYPSNEPWGYSNWKSSENAVLDILLEPAEGTNMIFRSMSTTPDAFVAPQPADEILRYGIVQYYATLTYWDKGGGMHKSNITSSQWTMPSWYDGFEDPNKKSDSFSPFTVLDSVSPGRAWFNEVNFTDGDGGNANQFIEICFPGNYDMTGWRIYRYDVWGNQAYIAALGLTSGVPSTKAATGGDPNFAFLALTDSRNSVAGADATWNSEVDTCVSADTYGFQLVRPSGIREHQVVVQGKLGTGRYSKNKLGTNVVAQLKTLVGGTWEFVGADTNAAVKSTGVFKNAGAVAGDWNSTMDMTPAALNGNQTIPPNWFLAPGGTNVWVALAALTDHAWVLDGDNLAKTKTLVVPLGAETNLVFCTSPWYQLGSLLRNSTNEVVADVTGSSGGSGATNTWTYVFKEDSQNSVRLDFSAMPSTNMLARGNLDPADPYTPAIMNWLLGGMANGEPFEGDDISTNCFYWGLWQGAQRHPLSLKVRYWLDIDPTSDSWDLRGAMGEQSNLAAPAPTSPVATEVRRSPEVATSMYWPEYVTNRVVSVTLMISNKTDNAKSRAPNRLQGIAGEKSDVVGARNWTSETFKVMMSLIKPTGSSGIDVSSNYWPMAQFVFDSGSFCGPDSEHPFSARIEVLDPMSRSSPAYSYQWWLYPGSGYGYRWRLSEGLHLGSPSMLKATNTWDNVWDVQNDY